MTVENSGVFTYIEKRALPKFNLMPVFENLRRTNNSLISVLAVETVSC